MISSYKFVQKIWLLHQQILEKTKLQNEISKEKNEIFQFTNQLIDKVTKNLEKFNYNVIIANFHEMYNFMIKLINKPINKNDLLENYKKILYLMLPVIPHLISECLEEIGELKNDYWPTVKKELLYENNVNIVVQVNGKKRLVLNSLKDIKEETLMKQITNNDKISKFIKNKKIIKTIFIKDKLINLIIEELI